MKATINRQKAEWEKPLQPPAVWPDRSGRLGAAVRTDRTEALTSLAIPNTEMKRGDTARLLGGEELSHLCAGARHRHQSAVAPLLRRTLVQ